MAQVEELGGNRVRLTVDVSPHELEHAVEHAASDLEGSVKIPGFRKGKVPRQVLLANVGKDRLWVEAVESHTTGAGCAAAASKSGIDSSGFEGDSIQTRSAPSGGGPVWSNSTRRMPQCPSARISVGVP